MLELLLTSFPAVFQYWRLKKRGEQITVWNMHMAVFAWLVLAIALFMTIFYYHPKSYSGLVPFRLAPVVPQVGGPVTDIFVINGQKVSKGDPLFLIESSRQKANVISAEAKIGEIQAGLSVAKAQLDAVQGKIKSARGTLKQTVDDLSMKQRARKKNKNTFSQKEINRLLNQRTSRQGSLDAVLAEYRATKANVKEALPAQLKSAEAALAKAHNELSKTKVLAMVNGTVTQVTLNEGASATRLVMSPSMLIIPDRKEDIPVRVIAGFSQTANQVLKQGMAVEIACETNANMAMTNVVMPARIAFKQDAIAAGQFIASTRLVEPLERAKRGSVLVFLEMEHKAHEDLLLNGSGCIVQAYTTGLPGFTGHIISALGIIKAILFRVKVWVSLALGVGLVGGK